MAKKNENKTRQNDQNVDAYLASIEHPKKREDSIAIKKMMDEVTGLPAKMWGDSIIGYGSYYYKSDAGREGIWMKTAFAPRKANISLYVMGGFGDKDEKLSRLGKHKKGVGCLYINKLADVDMEVLREIIEADMAYMINKYGEDNPDPNSLD